MIQNSGVRITPYLVGIVLFILPFFKVSCDGKFVVQFTGIQLVTGSESEMKDPMSEKRKKIPPEPLAVAALAALGIGVAFCIHTGRVRSIVAAVAGGVTLLAMLVLKTRMDAIYQASGLTVEYLAGFWGVCIAALAGLILSIMRVKDKPKDIG